jgi:hypothetical protein
MKSVKIPLLKFHPNKERFLSLDNGKHPRKLLLRDRALAVKHGKQLMEVDMKDYSTLAHKLNPDLTEASKFIIKTIAVKDTSRRCSVYVQNSERYSEIHFKEESVPGLDWDSISAYTNVDIMFDLADYLDEKKKNLGDQKVYCVRGRFPTKYFGFVPLDRFFLNVLAFIFAPLIVRDVLHSAFLSVVKTWLGPLAFIVTCIVTLFFIHDISRGRPVHQYKFFSGVVVTYVIGFLGMTTLAFPYSTNYFAALGMSASMLLYVVLLYEYTFPWNARPSQKRAIPALIALALIITMNDWKLTVDSVRNGVIWWRLYDNTVSYALFCLQMISLSCLAKISSSNRWEWRYLIDWDKFLVKLVCRCYGFVVFLTLYAPTWQGNHV